MTIETEPIVIIDSDRPRSDLRLVERAIRNGWNIPAAIMEKLPLIISNLVTKSDDERIKISASRVLVAMFGQNQNEQPVVNHVEHHHEIVRVEGETIDERRDRIKRRLSRLRDAERSR